jgi:hypothetical protein
MLGFEPLDSQGKSSGLICASLRLEVELREPSLRPSFVMQYTTASTSEQGSQEIAKLGD